MKNVFYGRFPIEQATALLQFHKKGITQTLLHALKYKGREEIGSFLGMWLGAELAECEPFQHIDLVVPVPLHQHRLRERGYNQVERFGREIATALQVPYRDDLLLKVSKSKSQVFKSRLLRATPEATFILRKKEQLNGAHVLLVDDIVTTGATIENCAQQLLTAKDIQLSVATMALA
jgi:ComF family protein